MAEQYNAPFDRDLLLAMAKALPAVGYPEAGRLYVPAIHAKALNPDSDLVEGMRGAGKTFWCSALQNDALRGLLASNPEVGLALDTKVTVGYGESTSNPNAPDSDTLIQLVERQDVTPYILWKTVLFHQVADGAYPEEYAAFNAVPDPWNARIQWVHFHPDQVASIFRSCDAKLAERGAYHIVLFDALDRTANDWQRMSEMLTGVLRVALFSRSYRRIRVKVFARPDQLAMTKMNAFTDASKIINSRFKLEWQPRELYGLLWQYLANGAGFGEYFRSVSSDHFGLVWREVSPGAWYSEGHQGRDEILQKKLFHCFTGPLMGAGSKKGSPYTWLPNHLGDADNNVSPRTFLTALQHAAVRGSDRSHHRFFLHHEDIRRGVWKASEGRVIEMDDDYPWASDLLRRLEGEQLPLKVEAISRKWTAAKDHALNNIKNDDKTRLPPAHLNEGVQGVLMDMERLGMVQSLRDGRINVPDVYRLGCGMKRRGGVGLPKL